MILLNSVGISPLLSAPKYIPVVNGQFTTGQYYFEGAQSSLGGNAGLTFVPALRYSNRFSLIPTLETQYRGTRSAEELAGGNTLFQDTWENAVGVKAVHGLGSKWKLREKASYRFKWFRETTDENWSKGLYDYRIISVGTELERLWGQKFSMALGYDFSFLQFPNYVSLESTQPTDLAREFAGEDVLDTNIHLLSLRSQMQLPWRATGQLQGFYSPRYYKDQHIVELSGLLTAEKRKDLYSGGTLSIERIFGINQTSNVIPTLYVGYTSMESNQNHYDARLTTFVSDFYDYDQTQVGGQLTWAALGKMANPIIVDVGYSYSRREYDHRVIQSADGNYLTNKLHVTETTAQLGFSYPISKSVRAKMSSTFGRSKSNNDYEAVYRYNYDTANYQFGFTYEY